MGVAAVAYAATGKYISIWGYYYILEYCCPVKKDKIIYSLQI